MRFLKRIGLLLLVNTLVTLTISILLEVFQVRPYLTTHGLDGRYLLAYSLIWGMTGALISLALSRFLAKQLLDVRVIESHSASPAEKQLLESVAKLARQVHLPEPPEVGIYSSPEVNAFATGPSPRCALIAVSTALCQRLSPRQIEGVLAHEMAHINNGDMVTMSLLQGVLNTFVLFFSRLLSFALSQSGRRKEGHRRQASDATLVPLFELLFMVLASTVIAAFSRSREFRADQQGAVLAGREKMIEALEALQSCPSGAPRREEQTLAAFKISSPNRWFFHLFATHPPLQERIRRLKEYIL